MRPSLPPALTLVHLSGELFKHMGGCDLVHVPHNGAGPARLGLIGGLAGVGMPKRSTRAAIKRTNAVMNRPLAAPKLRTWTGVFASGARVESARPASL